MDPEEQELFRDYRYRNYSSVIEKALRNFESSSEWADLISSLGKLNKALQSNLKYSLLPRRLIISKRLSQCLHPALPSGVHLKALETYEIIFKIIGTKWLAKDLFLYSSGLFPLLANAAMSVRPILLGLYEKYFLPLQKSLLPSLQAFVIGLLPGLEEGSEIYDRTDALLVKLSVLTGQEVFYAAIWGSVLVSPSIRLPASLFVVSHINRELSGKQQKYMLGTDYKLTVKSLRVSVLDSNVLVQRNTLEVLLFFFPFYTSLDYNESAIPLLRSDVVHILSAATQTLLRRDMSLNRRLYAWLLGSDIKGGTFASDSAAFEDHALYFFGKYSKDLLVEALIEILHQKLSEAALEDHAYLKPFRILISLLDKPEIGPQVVGDLFLEVIRAFYSYCKDALGSDLKLSYSQSGNVLTSAIKENRSASEIVKTVNLLITSLSTDFLWDYMTRCFEDCFRNKSMQTRYPTENVSTPPTISELCTLLLFLLDMIPLELYSEVQTQYLPQMLSYMVQSLLENVETLSLPELTHALKTCFKVLSKVQMPPAYLDNETGSENSSPVKQENSDITLETKPALQDEDDTAFAPLKSEDSGIGLSASSPELSQHLRLPRVTPERDDVWKNGGSIQRTLHCIQELVDKFASKYIFGVHLQDPGNGRISIANMSRGEKKENNYRVAENASKKKNPWEGKQITVPQFKQMLSDLFTVRGSPFKQKSLEPLSPANRDLGSKKGKEEWDIEQVMLDLGDMKEDCREAFAAACHLLLDCTTFPVYLSEEETEQLYLSLFQVPGGCDTSFPLWLKSLMTICCCVNDCYIQNVSISTLLEVINHSQSLALVIEDRMKRYKISGHNPFFGRLQMVTVPPIAPGVLKLISEKTDFYQRVAQVLWNQLNKETREHHITCVELFYRLHCLAPSANICEDIICHTLLDHDKGTRLEALFRFSVIWHLTREIQGSRVTSHNRSFDRSLFVVLDSLNCSDGAIGAAAQGWLIRALSLNDVARILEPVLLLLLHPKTQRTSIHCIKQKNSAEDLHHWFSKKSASFKESFGASELHESSSEENIPLSQFTTVDREAIWAEVEIDPETSQLKNGRSENEPSHCTERPQDPSGDHDNSEHTESADTSTGPNDSENTSSFSTSLDPQEMSNEENCRATMDCRENMKNVSSSNTFPLHGSKSSPMLNLVRADSEKTQASESLSSDEEVDLELQAITTSRLLKRQKEKQEMIEALFKHILLYFQPYDSKRVLYAFSVLEAVLKTNPKEFIEAVASTSMDTSSTAHLNLIYNLLARHQETLVGQSFYGKLQTQSPTMCPHSLLIELLTYLCLSFLRSYYPCYLKVTHRDVLGNRDVQVKSVEVLIRMMAQLATMAKSAENKNIEFIHNLLGRCKIQEFVLLSLSASMYTSQKRYELMTSDKITIKNKILDFLNPLTPQLGVQLISAVAAVWNSKKAHKNQSKIKILPVASASQLILVDLVCALNTLKTDTILQLVKEVVKKPSQIKGEEKSSLVDIPVLKFSYAFIQRLPVSALQENFQSLLGVLKESVQLNLAPPGYFLLLSTLNDFVTRTPNLENKKDQKDLQEVTQKILEAVGNVAGSSLEQTSWLSRNLEVKAQPQISLVESSAEDDLYDASLVPSSMVSASAPSIYSVQALSLLAEVLASLLDMVYRSDEKEKAVPLISRLMYYVFPYLRNHSAYNAPSFRAGARLLSSLSGYAYTKRAWKKEVLELFVDPAFFQMDTSCIHWRSIIDHLLTHEKTMFKDFMSMQSSSLKMFPSFEQKAMLLKRQAFAVFSGEIDQYHLYLPLIQERLTDNLRVGQTSIVAAQMFLFFRVLLLRISPQHLTSLWPIMVTELIQTFIQLEEDLAEEDEPSKSNSKVSRQKTSASADGSGPLLSDIQQNELSLYLSACKFLDTALSFPPDKMQLFQMYRWAFVPEVETETCTMTSHLMENHQECKPHIIRIMDSLKLKYGETNTNERTSEKCDYPLLNLRSISSITQLMPFFRTLSCAFKAQGNRSQNAQSSASLSVEYSLGNSTRILKQLEESVECDFLENLES
ncbi:protein dopey-2-like [Terrapene carolina triunguis]|uniref:protein dopey-2-like n=1 Tax=Terrapene triunguis TaxID=2587831 RepID=UPI000E77E432|nr:protein dopey-2-like [Terrapene carolina triunguis]